jgi:hypothetical protein
MTATEYAAREVLKAWAEMVKGKHGFFHMNPTTGNGEGIPRARTIRNGDDRGASSVMAVLEDYPGAKGASGLVQTIINQIPPHDTLIECFAGSAVLGRKIKAATSTIVVDVDAAVCKALKTFPELTVINGDAISFLRSFPWKGKEVVYCDPPYLFSARSCQRRYYQHEFGEPGEHERLIYTLKSLPCYVILSGYWSELYGRLLKDWRTIAFDTVTHRGKKATEWLWLNFPEPFDLHDYRFLGKDYRERERIKKRKRRWRDKLGKMGRLERFAILEAVNEARTANLGVVDQQQFPLRLL